jgi:hypothetical protein
MDKTLDLLEQRVEEAAVRLLDLADARDRLDQEVRELRGRLDRQAGTPGAVDRQLVVGALRHALDELRAD